MFSHFKFLQSKIDQARTITLKMETGIDDEMALSEHIEEFSQRLIFCLICLILATLFCFADVKEIVRISKPGMRVYSSVKSMPSYKNNMGIAILSTSKGVMTNFSAQDSNIGGEILCRVY